ncbi:MAG: carbon-nitrogen hydrolase family protein [Paenibacillus sp.]|jgi:predicted amidohydrolase|nr:carbon-nitrogen hydrolase family protein [Paenibacillus sp.]
MAKYVTISCVAAPSCHVPSEADMETAVGHVIRSWDKQLKHVLPDRPDLIVLPECCDKPAKPGMTLDWLYDFYRYRGKRIAEFFGSIARANRCYIAYSAMIEEPDGTFRNATWLIDRHGDVSGVYNKNHLTIKQKSTSSTLYGKDAPLFQTDFGKIACAICFDLNFNVLLEQYVRQKPDLIVFSSAYHGGLMQPYWAYACRAYFAGSVYAPNPCSIISPVGDIISESTNYYPYVTQQVNMDYAVIHLDYNMPRIEAMKQKYGPKVRVTDPGRLGSVLLTSETDELTVRDLIAEFEFELLDDYLLRSLDDRCKAGHLEP